jgi:hypothetical protein
LRLVACSAGALSCGVVPWGQTDFVVPWGQTDFVVPWGQIDLEFFPQEILNRSDPKAPDPKAPRVTPIHSATTGGTSQNCNLYDVCLAFVQPSIKVLGVNIPVIEVDLFSPGIDVLLGRDMLGQCLCIYDGQSSTFVLAF